MKFSYKYLLLAVILCFTLFFIAQYFFIKTEKDSFNWQMEKNTTIRVYLNQHPYAEAIIKAIPEFERTTGINVEYFVSDESVFQKKVFYFLQNKPSEVDVFMTGPYHIWRNAYDGLIADLSPYINNPAYVSKEYNYDDFHPQIMEGLKYNYDGMHQDSVWAMPLGFELTSIIYNKRLFEKAKISPPNNFTELSTVMEKLKKYDKNIVPLGIRGLNFWSTICSSYINLYYNYGLSDFYKKDHKLVPNVNSRASVQFNEQWLNLIKKYGDPNLRKVSWYELGANLGSGKYAMIFDADFIGYSQNISDITRENGNIDIHQIMGFNKTNPASNLWVWGLGINNASNKKLASWLFIQYFTSSRFFENALKKYPYMNPPRINVLKSTNFSEMTSEKYKNYLLSRLPNARVLMTPQPYAMEVMDRWIATLYDIQDGKYKNVQEGLDVLNNELNNIVKDIMIER